MKPIFLTPLLLLGACSQVSSIFSGPSDTKPAAATASSEDARPQARPAPEAGSGSTAAMSSGRSADSLDTTSEEERAAASSAPAAGGETRLGTSVASLGDPARSGFWLETPLVSSETEGRVVFPGTGKSAQVQLIPIEGPATGGSRISLSAMRLIGAPLTDLPTLEVYSGG